MKVLKSVLAVMVLSVAAMAQAPKPPAINELQQARLENLSLKMGILRQQYDQLQQQKGVLTEEIAKANPGYRWVADPKTGQEGLVPNATPAKPVASPAAKK